MRTMEFLDEYLALKKIDGNRLSSLIKSQILLMINSGAPGRVVEEIAHLEGLGATCTKAATKLKDGEFKGKDYWHKHYNYGGLGYIAKNLMNHWGLEKKGDSRFNKMALDIGGSYAQDGFLPDKSNPQDLWNYSSELANKFMEGYEER